MADLYSKAAELLRTIKYRNTKMEFKPLPSDSDYQFKQISDELFAISQRFLRVADSENGVRSCQGYYYNQCSYTYDPPQFFELRKALADQGYIILNTSEHLNYDAVIKAFSLNGKRLYVGDKFMSAIWHSDRDFSD